MRLLIAAILAIFTTFGIAAAATQSPKQAYTTARLSKQDQQLLSRLSPEARKEVLSRLTPGQTVKEILDTMALNRLSALYSEGRVVQADVIQGVATVEYKDGTRKQVPFEINEIVLSP
jgi:hypothetical protein